VAAHNEHCTNSINPEEVIRQKKAEADAKRAEDEAAAEKELRDKRQARLEKEKSNALTALMNKLVSDAFVPPLNGWTRAAVLPNGSFYLFCLASVLLPIATLPWTIKDLLSIVLVRLDETIIFPLRITTVGIL
jgi:hypothetical protein